MAICLPASQKMTIFVVATDTDGRMKAEPKKTLPAISITPIHATRPNIWDLLVVKPNREISIMTHGIYELPVTFALQGSIHPNTVPTPNPHGRIASVTNDSGCSMFTTFTFDDGWSCHDIVDLFPQDLLTQQALQILAHSLPPDLAFKLHRLFYLAWAQKSFRTSDGVEFDCFVEALYSCFGLGSNGQTQILDSGADAWQSLQASPSRTRYREDPVLQVLKSSSGPRKSSVSGPTVVQRNGELYKYLVASLYALHTLSEQMRVLVHRYADLLRVVPVICHMATYIRPEWADYWRRLCPDAIASSPWPSPALNGTSFSFSSLAHKS